MIEDGIWYKIREIGVPTHEYEFTSLDPEIKDGTDKHGKPRSAELIRSDLKYNEKNIYQRHVVSKWLSLGWVEKNDRTAAKYSITPKGESLLHIYKTPIDFRDIICPIKEMKVEFKQMEFGTTVKMIELK